MDFLDFVLRLNGKGGPSLLVPSGVLTLIQFRPSCALFVTRLVEIRFSFVNP